MDFVGFSSKLVGVYDQISAFAMEEPIQPDRDAIWMSNFVSSELLAIDLRDIDCDLRAQWQTRAQCNHHKNHKNR